MDYVQIKDIRPGLKNINVVFIILEIGHPTVTKENREVRTCKVADPTACINVSLWDEPGQLLVPGDIVRLTKGYSAIWRNCLTLYSGKNGDIQKMGEFCMVFTEQPNMSEPNPALTPFFNQGPPAAGGGIGGNNGSGSNSIPGGNGNNGGNTAMSVSPSNGNNGGPNNNQTPSLVNSGAPPSTAANRAQNSGGAPSQNSIGSKSSTRYGNDTSNTGSTGPPAKISKGGSRGRGGHRNGTRSERR
ncbi:SOSS complex subunit B homolog [Ischnura elegans]|uniref:SOSS complex subunit B homolog n=1 Tax=Ischnura elegans TaxID=197161 RepID=UPI001ED875AF|nr:SOSS complex subunit B homolog [Ischnura elegans]